MWLENLPVGAKGSAYIEILKPVSDGYIDFEKSYIDFQDPDSPAYATEKATYKVSRSCHIIKEIRDASDKLCNVVYDNTEYAMKGSYKLNSDRIPELLQNPAAVITSAEELDDYLADYFSDVQNSKFKEKYNEQFFEENILLINSYLAEYGEKKVNPVNAEYNGNDITVTFTEDNWSGISEKSYLDVMQVYFPKKYYHADSVNWKCEEAGTPEKIRFTVTDYDTGEPVSDFFRKSDDDLNVNTLGFATGVSSGPFVSDLFLMVSQNVSVKDFGYNADCDGYYLSCPSGILSEDYCLPFDGIVITDHSNFSVDVELKLKSVSSCDITGDNKINAADVTALEKIMLGCSSGNEFDTGSADFNNDGKVNLPDICLLKELVTDSSRKIFR